MLAVTDKVVQDRSACGNSNLLLNFVSGFLDEEGQPGRDRYNMRSGTIGIE